MRTKNTHISTNLNPLPSELVARIATLLDCTTLYCTTKKDFRNNIILYS